MDKCPCTDCLVKSACNMDEFSECPLILDFMNNIADQIMASTADEVHKYRTTTSPSIMKKVEVLLREDKKFAYPEYIKAFWHDLIPAHRHERLHTGP